MTGIAPAAVAGAAAVVAIPLIATAINPAAGTTQPCRTATKQPAATATTTATTTAAGAADSVAADTIPADYLARYQSAGSKYGIPWQVLAGVGNVESDHGRSTSPGVRTGANTAGAMGPMQFLPATWRTYGVDGDHDGRRDIYDPDDAIPAAARYLKHSGAPDHMQAALFTYNHSPGYVRLVLAWAHRYATGHHPAPTTTCPTAPASPTSPNTRTIQKVIAYARAQIGKPYRWGGVGPDAYDCSGLVYAAYRAAGITLHRTTYTMWPAYPHIRKGHEQPGDLIFFIGAHGTRSRPGHMALVTGSGKMIEARCPTCGPIKTASYRTRNGLVGFARPLADHATRKA
jgi:cell wall-associated NlpC family hydrolase